MTNEKLLSPDYLFEVSWEVCNKVGGIYTVISTKAPSIFEKLDDNYLLIGPDVWKETRNNPEFIEDKFLYKSWCVKAESEGLKFKIGRWNISGNPIVILVDFTPFFIQKDIVFSRLWEKYQLDSISGQWDYIEPALFGIAAAYIIKSFYEFNLSAHDRIIAQFHEWMTGAGVLYLNDKSPQIGTVLTTHATVLGRCIAGNNLPLYGHMTDYNPENLARTMGVVSKFSLEKIAAQQCDCFTTVSEITANECSHFLEKSVVIITPNGFDDSFVPAADVFEEKRIASKQLIKHVTESLLNQPLADNTLYLLNSGRYEFHNKGIDLYIDSLGQLNKSEHLSQNIVAFIAVPANNMGPSHNLINRMKENDFSNAICGDFCTHFLSDYNTDAMILRIKANNLTNSPSDKVKIVIVPCYLDSNDGIFNSSYYDFLIGFDLTVFPSYYEPWGYTPLESIAFHIPTITTTLAGFGMWALSKSHYPEKFVSVIKRDDENSDYVTEMITKRILEYANSSDEEKNESRDKAFELSRLALWQHLSINYLKAYHIALQQSAMRFEQYKSKSHSIQLELKPKEQLNPIWKKILIKPSIPEELSALYKLSRNLWWTWNSNAVDLFEMINPILWEQCKQNPITLLESISFDEYRKLEKNTAFLEKLQDIYGQFNAYMCGGHERPHEQIAYFSMEFGLHHSLKIYSGGLGILAGDYLKQASDSNENMIGVSLLYRYGYFDQSISLLGDQIAAYPPQKYSHLPLIPVRKSDVEEDEPNNWLKVHLAAPGRTIIAKVWKVDVGRAALYLLDTDIEDNLPEDRIITHSLYGGGSELRFKQELLLGVGGIRVLEQIGSKPNIYHCNEGHAAFIGIERLRKYVYEENLTFNEAVEVVKASSLFTTHTPVPAGHDTFSEDILRTYIPHYADRLKISWNTFMNLGKVNENDPDEKFSMSVLAATLSSDINGVSKIHGRVTRHMFSNMYPGYFPKELHIGYVTNGVHFPTWVSKRWKKLYDETFNPAYINDQSNPDYWKKIYEVPDEAIWGIRQHQRSDLVDFLRQRLMNEMTLRQDNPQNIFNVSENLDAKALTIGFARRFATYKRAHLLFTNLERLAKIVNNKLQPVQFVYAGKAHPNDKAGQDLIKKIYEISNMPEFVGKILIVENYDIEVGKRLTQGVDIWLNTPTRPLEASGTSGEKAVMNGVINFSVLDGWWAEGYKPEAGWALKEERTYQNQNAQDALDSVTIYNMLENEIIPMFYNRNKEDIPTAWVQKIKNTIALIAPEFTMKRMLDDYRKKFYNPIIKRSAMMNADNFLNARKLSSWKQKMLRSWESIEVIAISTTDSNKKPLGMGEKFFAEIILKLNELNDNDVGIEILFGQKNNDIVDKILFLHEMKVTETKQNEVTFYYEMPAMMVGVFDYSFRLFPKNPLLTYRQDFSLMKWL
ncbi:MAG: alpha-glucan family phosphorylase [Bacteroidota bacterium]